MMLAAEPAKTADEKAAGRAAVSAGDIGIKPFDALKIIPHRNAPVHFMTPSRAS